MRHDRGIKGLRRASLGQGTVKDLHKVNDTWGKDGSARQQRSQDTEMVAGLRWFGKSGNTYELQ